MFQIWTGYFSCLEIGGDILLKFQNHAVQFGFVPIALDVSVSRLLIIAEEIAQYTLERTEEKVLEYVFDAKLLFY